VGGARRPASAGSVIKLSTDDVQAIGDVMVMRLGQEQLRAARAATASAPGRHFMLWPR